MSCFNINTIHRIVLCLAILVGLDQYAKSQSNLMQLELQYPDAGNKVYNARDCIMFKPGYSYTASSSQNLSAYLDYVIGNVNYSTPFTSTTFPGFLDYNLPVGYTPGEAVVDLFGSANYTIPIQVPIGVNGLQPQLSVSYNSNSNNNILGFGWQLNGLSSISRVPKNIFNDGKVEPILHSSFDKYSLDGNRLAIQTIGVPNIYVTENETYSRITAQGVTGSSGGPMWFTVETKDGLTMEYGNTTDSKFLSNDGKPMIWYLNKITDNYGNSIEFTYLSSFGNNVISEIKYGGNPSQGHAHINTIKFYYDKRSDKTSLYVSNSTIDNQLLLTGINEYTDGYLFKNYEFTYFNEIYSYLKEVKEYGGDHSHLNSTRFLYGNTSNPTSVLDKSSEIDQSAEYRVGDFNGDGVSDIAAFTFTLSGSVRTYHRLKCYLNNGSGSFSLSSDITLPTGFFPFDPLNPFTHSNRRNQGIDAFDLNGDGMDDLLLGQLLAGSYFYVPYISNGTTFLPPSVPPSNEAYGLQINTSLLSDHSFTVGDFNGDGLLDGFAYNKTNDFHVLQMFKDGNEIVGSSYDPLGSYTPHLDGDFFIPIDVDGDGTTELLTSDGANSIILDVKLEEEFDGTGASIGYDYELIEVYRDLSFPNLATELHEGDFNGDAKTDFLGLGGSSYAKEINTYLDFDVTSFAFSFDPAAPVSQKYTADVNGDGKTDIVQITLKTTSPAEIANIHVYLSNGNNYIQKTVPVYIPFTSGAIFDFGDFNGDGSLEILYKTPTQTKIIELLNNQKQYLLHKVANGHNVISEFEYEPLSKGNTIYTKGSTSIYPVIDLQNQLYVVSSFTKPDDFNGDNITTYKYESASVHRRGRGYLGFKKIIEENNVFNTRITKEIETDPVFFIPLVKHESYENTLTNFLISEKTNDYSVTSLGGSNPFNKKYSVNQTQTIEFDYLHGFNKETLNSYDAFGNIISTTLKSNSVYEITTLNTSYTTAGSWIPSSPVSITKTTTRFGESPITRSTFFSYNTQGSPITQTTDPGDPKSVVTTYTYDGFGNITSTVISASGVSPKTTGITYDINFRYVKTYSNTLGQVKSVTVDPRWGKPILEKSIDNLTTTSEFDSYGRLKKVISPTGVETTIELDWETGPGEGLEGDPDYPFDQFYPLYFSKASSLGSPDLTTYFDKLNHNIKSVTSGFNNPIFTQSAYDERGNVLAQKSPHFETDPGIITSYSYDDYNRISQVSNPLGSTTYSYSGAASSITNPAGHTRTQIMDPTGKLISSEDDGGTIIYSYFSSGLQKSIQINGITMSSMSYDLQGNQLTLDDKNAGISTYEYDAFGQLTKQTDANGSQYIFTYDVLGRLISRTGPDGLTSFSFVTSGNGLNQPSLIMGPNGYSQQFTYDSKNRLTKHEENIDAEIFKFEYNYNDNNQATLIKYPGGFELQKNYDDHGFLTSVYSPTTSSNIYTSVSRNAYDLATEYDLGNGLTTEISYNSFGMLQRSQSGSVHDMEYDFDLQSGNLLSRTDHIKGLAENFEYDNLNRLTNVIIPPFTNVTEVTYANNGNILTKSDAGNYTYDFNKINAITELDNTPSTVPQLQQDISYTPFNKAQNIVEGDFEEQLFYGPDQQRRKSILLQLGTPLKTRFYIGAYEKETDATNTREVNYIHCDNKLHAIYVVENGIGTMNYVYTDHLGSIQTITDESANIITEQSFDAWGRQRNPLNWTYTGIPASPNWLWRGYTGHEQMPQFGLINMNGRMYDPILGRMLSPDNFIQDAMFSQNYNRYSYVMNNPLLYTDPEGQWFGVDDAIVAGTSFLAGYLTYGFTTGEWGKDAFVSGGIAAASAWLIYNTAGLASSALLNLGVAPGLSSLIGNGIGGAVGSFAGNVASQQYFTGGVDQRQAGQAALYGFGYGFGAGAVDISPLMEKHFAMHHTVKHLIRSTVGEFVGNVTSRNYSQMTFGFNPGIVLPLISDVSSLSSPLWTKKFTQKKYNETVKKINESGVSLKENMKLKVSVDYGYYTDDGYWLAPTNEGGFVYNEIGVTARIEVMSGGFSIDKVGPISPSGLSTIDFSGFKIDYPLFRLPFNHTTAIHFSNAYSISHGLWQY